MRRTLLALPLVLTLGCYTDYGFTPVSDEEPVRPDAEEVVDEEPVEETEDETPPEEEEDDGTNTNEEPPVEEEEPPVEEEEPPADDCVETSDLVYVIDRDEEALYLFDPPTGTFSLVGALDCGLWAGTPASMAVSRTGVAYVRYSDQTVYAVNLATMSCAATAYSSAFGSFGMGFATDSASTWQDAMYVANGSQLATLDSATWGLTTVGGMPSQSELTGNAAGELWAMLPLESPARIVQLSKATAQPTTTFLLPGFPNPMNIDTFAFATWGGEFWLFVRTYGMGHSTEVYKVSASGALTLVAADTGMDVVGAGVSTCAPTGS